MKNDLSNLSKKELWQLFPIELVSYNPSWENWFCSEKKKLTFFLPYKKSIHHIGSSAVKTICSKPVVDILLVCQKEDYNAISTKLLQYDYILMSKSRFRHSFNKGYTSQGYQSQVFHLHLRLSDDIDELYFKQLLVSDESIAKEYEKLKRSLAVKYKYNRDRYTLEKTDFIKKYTEKAKTMFTISVDFTQ